VPSSYTGNPANAASNTVTISEPADADLDNGATFASAFQLLTDYAQRLVNFVIAIFSTANTWTATQTFTVGAAIGGAISATGSGSNVINATASGAGYAGVIGGASGAGGFGTSGIAQSGAGAGGVGIYGGSQDVNAWPMQAQHQHASPVVGAFNLVPHVTPSAPANGDTWVDSSNNTFSARINGATAKVQAQSGPTNISSFLNSFSAGSTTPRYYRDSNGRTYVSGNVSRATATTYLAAFNLPAGFRPPSTRQYACFNGSAQVVAGVVVTTGGDVQVVVANNGDTVQLDGISFETF